MRTVYEAAGGSEGLQRLARAWHDRVMADEVVSHAFSHGYHLHHVERLAASWGEALGGPKTFTERYGNETTVVRMHSGNGVHEEMDRRAIACFDQALVDAGLAADGQLRDVLHDTSRGQPQRRWLATTARPTTCRRACRSPVGRGADSWRAGDHGGRGGWIP